MEDKRETIQDLERRVGQGMRALRLDRNITQAELAAKSSVAFRAITNLENGKGSSLATLLRVLKALDATDGIERLVPQPMISPMAMLKTPTPPQRVRRSKRNAS